MKFSMMPPTFPDAPRGTEDDFDALQGAFRQLTRYGAPRTAIVEAVEKIADLNDDLEHDREKLAGKGILVVPLMLTEAPARLEDGHPLWCLNAQLDGLLRGEGASEDHDGVLRFLRSTGLPQDTISRVHRALVFGDAKDRAFSQRVE